ncbi:MAG: hypothetical protein ACN6QH_13735 [Pseudomonas sp.]|uniref:hypothetical protein n=1 Tax=Pseudomonas sp. TaxID=306 RepID=UPI003D0C01B3
MKTSEGIVPNNRTCLSIGSAAVAVAVPAANSMIRGSAITPYFMFFFLVNTNNDAAMTKTDTAPFSGRAMALVTGAQYSQGKVSL